MILRLLLIAILLDVCCAVKYLCPTKIRPCQCRESSVGLDITCQSVSVYEVREVLANVVKTQQPVYYLTLKDIQMTNLPSHLLMGLNLENLVVLHCRLSSVDEDAFVDVAGTLNQLILPHNSLEWVPSQAMEKLSSLTYLNLKFNKLEVLHADAFKGLHSLIRLSLYGNKIKYIDSAAFSGIGSKFKHLRLDGNDLMAVPSLPLRNLSSIDLLELQDNQIATLKPGQFASMASGETLIQLILANNRIRQLPQRAFTSLVKLNILDLSGNEIEYIHPFAFQGIEDNLLFLNLDNNRLKDVPSESLKNMSQLNYLDLGRNEICKIRKDDFLPYGKNLTYIHLHENSLTSVDPSSMVPLTSLKRLNLRSNQLTTVPYETYAPVLETLELLDVHDNPLHCDCDVSWLSHWMNESASSIVKMANETKCFSPQEHAGVPLVEIPTYQLVCENLTSKPPEPCCNCMMNSQQHLSSDTFGTVLLIGFVYFVTLNMMFLR